MTKEEAKQVFLSRGFVEVEGGTIYDADKWRESCHVISEWLEQWSSRDIEEIEEVINCDVDAETKCKMISNILTAKPHYFKKQEPKTGHWIVHEEQFNALGMAIKGGVKCSECGYTTHNKLHMEIGCPFKFCPDCGKRMIER